jgi:hypothetical protein
VAITRSTEALDTTEHLAARRRHRRIRRIALIIIGVCVIFAGLAWIWHTRSATSKQSCGNPQIKGNISYRTGEKIYHMPGGMFYDRTEISQAAGERMFCTEDEAKAAGFRRSAR